MPARPKSLSVAAILMLVYGAMGLMGALQSLLVSTGTLTPPGGSTSPMGAVLRSPEYRETVRILIIPMLVGGGLALSSGIGALRGRQWGRRLGLCWGVWALIVGPVGAWVTFSRIVPILAASPAPPHMTAQQAMIFHQVMQVIIIGVSSLGVLLGLAIAITVMILLTRPQVVLFCKGISQPAGTPPPLA